MSTLKETLAWPRAFSYDFGVDPLLQQDRGAGVAQVVQADAEQVDLGAEAFEGLARSGGRRLEPRTVSSAATA